MFEQREQVSLVRQQLLEERILLLEHRKGYLLLRRADAQAMRVPHAQVIWPSTRQNVYFTPLDRYAGWLVIVCLAKRSL